MESHRFSQIAISSKPFRIRCGCRGRYFEPGSKGYARAWNKFRKLDPVVMMPTRDENINLILVEDHRGSAVSNSIYDNSNDIWIDLWLDNDKTITLYFKRNA